MGFFDCSFFSSFYSFFSTFFFIFVMGWVSAFFFRKQLLFSLLSLEFLVLSLFLFYLGVVSFSGGCLSVTFYLLVLGACEAALGLCMLVSMVRLCGSDMLGMFSLVKC